MTPHEEELEAAIDRVRRLHSQDTSMLAPGKWCPGCGFEEPCPTIRALNGQVVGAEAVDRPLPAPSSDVIGYK